MKAAILSFYDFEEVQGGIELFCKRLEGTFPTAEHLTYSKSHKGSILPPLTKVNAEFARMAISIDWKLAELHRKDPFDLVLSNDITGLGMKLLTPDLPGIVIFHYTYRELAENALKDSPGRSPSKYFMPWLEKFTTLGKTTVAVSYNVQRALKRYYGIRARVIENGVPLDVFKPMDREDAREQLGIKWKGPLGIFVGRMNLTKGFDIVQAIARMRRDIRILCVSGNACDDPYLIGACKVRNEQMPLYYAAADFLLFPSRYESLSYASIEAIACDLPVVANRTGVFEDVDEKRVGAILTSEDPLAYSEAIDRVLRTELHPRSLAIERFSLEHFNDQYMKLAKEILKD